jgi:hypothetical protein
MIITGDTHTGRGLGGYLLKDKNDRVEVWGIRGDIERDLPETLDDWRSDALGTRCGKPLYHAQFSPDRTLSREEFYKAIELFEKVMGFENQPRVIVLHENKGRQHFHIVYSRMDENGHAIPDSWNYPDHEKAAREIEKILGLEKTQGVFIDLNGERPERTPSQAAIQQADRLNLDLKQIKTEVAKLYQYADNGHAFVAALESEGYKLARGDLGSYVIVDKVGGVHSLLRFVDVKADQLRNTLRDYSLQNLPSVQAAQSEQRLRQQAASVEKQKAPIELYSEIQNEKPAAKSLTLAERIQKNQQERLKRGNSIGLRTRPQSTAIIKTPVALVLYLP